MAGKRASNGSMSGRDERADELKGCEIGPWGNYRTPFASFGGGTPIFYGKDRRKGQRRVTGL